MALDICAEALIRLFFLTVKLLINHWGWALTIMGIALILQRFPFIIGFLGDAMDFLLDLIKDALVATVIGSLIFGGLGVMIMSILWTALALGSKANIVLRLVAAPFFFLAGALVGAFPIPLPGLTIMLDYGLKNESIANYVCFVPLVLLVLAALGLGAIFGQSLCDFLNTVLLSLS